MISDAEAGLTSAGFVVGIDALWVPEFGFSYDELEAAATPYAPQYLAALRVFHFFFASLSTKAWVHLAASMQAGKTGVVTALIRLMMIGHNLATIKIRPADIFVITGMNDDAWKKQTKERLPRGFRENVHHNKGLVNVQKALHSKAARNGGILCDVLIIQDESHFACNTKNQPSRMIYDTLCALCPPSEWIANNIRLLTISATDPSAVIGVGAHTEISAVVKLYTTEGYQSPEMLLASGRLHDTFNLVDEASIRRMLSFVTETYGDEPLYHILRPKQGKGDAVAEILRNLCPTATVIPWDSKSKSKKGGDDKSSLTSMEDINKSLLEIEPATITFIVIKNMFYAAKTLDDTHVGLMHDRIGHKDDTNLQSLVGRGSGYNKSTRTHVFGSLATVRHYIDVWSKITPTETVFASTDASTLRGKMPGVTVRSTGDAAVLSVAATRRLPTACGGAGSADEGAAAPAPKRVVHSEDDYESEWSPWYTTEEEVNAQWKAWGGQARRLNTNEDGFKVCSTTGSAKVVKKEEIDNFRSGKKTSNMPIDSKIEVGKAKCRRYVAYTDITNKETAIYCVHMVRRIK